MSSNGRMVRHSLPSLTRPPLSLPSTPFHACLLSSSIKLRSRLCSTGDMYRGEWETNLMQGKGKFVCNTGTYQGEFFNHQMHGKGRFDFKGGGCYYGQYVEGKREGDGIMAYPDQSVYEGKWERNVRQGFGTIQFANNDVYEGKPVLCAAHIAMLLTDEVQGRKHSISKVPWRACALVPND